MSAARTAPSYVYTCEAESILATRATVPATTIARTPDPVVAAWTAAPATVVRTTKSMTAVRTVEPVAKPVFNHDSIAFDGILFCTGRSPIG